MIMSCVTRNKLSINCTLFSSANNPACPQFSCSSRNSPLEKPPQPLPPPVYIQLPLRRPKPHAPPPIPTTTILSRPITPISFPDNLVHSTSTRKKTASSTSSDILRLMDGLGLPLQPEDYALLMKECTVSGDSAGAADLHAHLFRERSSLCLKANLPALTNRLLLMYVSCGYLDTARHLFDQMSVRKELLLFDFNSWAILMMGYLHNARYDEAFTLFAKMVQNNCHCVSQFPPWFVACMLEASGNAVTVGLGRLDKQVLGLLLKLDITS